MLDIYNLIHNLIYHLINTNEGSMYKAPGSLYSIYGTNRKEGLKELKKQLLEIENLLVTFETSYPTLTGI